MSLLKNLFKSVVSSAQQAMFKEINKQFSALPPGRMKETDIVKGPNCIIPEEPGIYRHVNKTTRVIEYVGQTDNLRRRQQQHVSSGKLNLEKQFVQFAVAREGATKDDLIRTEKSHIKRHAPKDNRTKGGNGRR